MFEDLKGDYIEGRTKKRELGYAIQDSLQVSQGLAYKIRRRLLLEVQDEKSNQDVETRENGDSPR